MSSSLKSISLLDQSTQRYFVAAAVTIFAIAMLKAHGEDGERSGVHYPPVVHIPENEMFRNSKVAYERALKKQGNIIGVQRKGRLEYIVSDQLAQDVLTSNVIFSFEEGTAEILNLTYFHKLFGSFFRDIDDLVRNAVSSRMGAIVNQVFPVFVKHVDRVMPPRPESKYQVSGNASVDVFDLAHKSISEAMTLSILGSHFVNDKNLAIIEEVANKIAVLTGLYQNTSKWARTFPAVWKVVTWIKVIYTSIFPFFWILGPQVWKDLHPKPHNLKVATSIGNDYDSVLEYLVHKHEEQEGKGSKILAFLRIMCLILGLMFASVHQTASVSVWIVYEIATHPEYHKALREELISLSTVDPSTGRLLAGYEALQEATYLDSFIREVLRTKGDTLSTCRKTTRDVSVGGFIIPKGHMVIPMATLSHLSPEYHGPDASKFVGDRWVSTGKQAVTVSSSYFPFGLGRWACPGRVLAVAELKILAWAILHRATPVLEGNRYHIVDPLNITSVPPLGKCTFVPYQE